MPSPKNSKKADKDASRDGFADLVISEDFISQQKARNWEAISPQYRGFAEEYLINGYDHRAAAAEVGISPNGALRVLRKPIVRAYIATIQERIFDQSIVNRDFVDSQLDRLLEMALGEVEVNMVDGKTGSEFTAKKFQGQLALEIIREKSRMYGVTKPEVDAGDILGAFAQAVQGNLPKVIEG